MTLGRARRPTIVLTISSRPRGKACEAASFSDTHETLAPVSTMKRNGPLPLIITGAVTCSNNSRVTAIWVGDSSGSTATAGAAGGGGAGELAGIGS